jgi:peptidoglycan/LPS O-acetylase OafA/YrhL
LLLWHWPFLAFARNWYGADLTFVQVTAVNGLALFASVHSWRYVEQPLLDHTVNSLPFLKLGTAAAVV